jgi:biotin carboxyl carrier protein
MHFSNGCFDVVRGIIFGFKAYLCDMLKVKVNGKAEHAIEFSDKALSSGSIDGKQFECDIIEVKNGSFHVIKDNRSYTVEVVKADPVEKTFTVTVNGNKYSLSVKDKYDDLLKSLGMDNLAGGKVNEIKAPMPGLVLDIVVAEGATVKKGDPVIVLEAMKMENILKSPADGTVKKINVKKGVAVEKNQVLINFA